MSTAAIPDRPPLHAVPPPTTTDRFALLLRILRAARRALDLALTVPRAAAGWVIRQAGTLLAGTSANGLLTGAGTLLRSALGVVEKPSGSPMWTWVLGPREQIRMRRPRLKIHVPSGRRKPDSFYTTVADAYLSQATVSNRAAKDLALANDVPVTTVHRWLKEARARGLLRLPRSASASSEDTGSRGT